MQLIGKVIVFEDLWVILYRNQGPHPVCFSHYHV